VEGMTCNERIRALEQQQRELQERTFKQERNQALEAARRNAIASVCESMAIVKMTGAA
jgi:hypothetical protein